MKANKFYSVPYDGHHYTDVRMLARLLGMDRFEAYGRWHALLGVLYQAEGRIELNDHWLGMLGEELAYTPEELGAFLEACAEVDMVDKESLEQRNVLISAGVVEALMERAERSKKGSNMANKRWEKEKAKAKK